MMKMKSILTGIIMLSLLTGVSALNTIYGESITQVKDVNATGVICDGAGNCLDTVSGTTAADVYTNITANQDNITDLWTNATNQQAEITLLQDKNSINQTDADALYPLRADWTTIDSYPTACAGSAFTQGLGDTLTCTDVNTTIDDRVKSINYNVTQIATVSGTPSAANALINVQTLADGLSYNVTEQVADPSLEIMLNITDGITSFDQIVQRIWYSGGGGHIMYLYIWDYTNSEWDLHYSTTGTMSFQTSVISVPDSSLHISGGIIRLNWTHTTVGAGVTAHVFRIDYTAAVKGFSGSTISAHDSLDRRDLLASNHPWAVRLNTNITANQANVTDLWTNATNQDAALTLLWQNATDQDALIAALGGDITAVNMEYPLVGNASTGDALLQLTVCADNEILKVATDVWACEADLVGGDIYGVFTTLAGQYIYNGSSSGSVYLAFNETRLNNTILEYTNDLWTNASGQATHITDLWTNATGQTSRLTGLDTSITDLWSNATDQDAHITNLWTNATDQDAIITANTVALADYLPLAGGSMTGDIASDSWVNSTTGFSIGIDDKPMCFGAVCDSCMYWNSTALVVESPCSL